MAELLLLGFAAVGLLQGPSRHQVSSTRNFPISRNIAAVKGKLPHLSPLPRASAIQQEQYHRSSLRCTALDIGKTISSPTDAIIDRSDVRNFLQMPAVSVAKFSCLSPLDACCAGWQLGDNSLDCTIQDVISGPAGCLDDIGADTSSIFSFSPKAARKDMCRLLYLFATSVLEAGLAEPATQLRVRLRVTDLGKGPSCPRLHFDKVKLRLTCAYQGEGTTWLPDNAVNRAALRWLTEAPSGNALRDSILQNTEAYNSLLRLPWEKEQQTATGEVLLLKGLGYSTLLDAQHAHAFVPAVHRSPSSALGAARTSDQLGSCRRALFTVDF